MDFSNPAAGAKERAARYVSDLLELLGDRDPLETMEELLPALRRAVEGLEDGLLRTREAPGKWSVLEVLLHLADTELVYRYRMRKIVAEPGSVLPGYDQDAWARGLGYGAGELESAFEELATLRRANLRWLRGLGDEELDRVGVHEERGPESVRRITQLLAAHDLVHRNQIQRIKAAVL